MSRIIFPRGKQKSWLQKVLINTKLSKREIANICGVTERTFRDWLREKFTISENALLRIKFHLKIKNPPNIKKVADYWYIEKGNKIGGLRRFKLYGSPGTPEGRKKGGCISQQRRRQNPEKYRLLGCKVRKNFKPLKFSKDLAEVIGIILGDGGITDYQLRITLGRETDREYANYVKELFYKVFGELPKWSERSNDKVIDLIISGINLIDNLSKIGIYKGNKIHRQIDLPIWIWKKKEYKKACLRGLMDTDGGVYFHNHWTKGIKYRNLGICFTSWSKPLIKSISKILNGFDIKHSIADNTRRIYIYNLLQVKKYFLLFNSNNPKHRQKLNYHLKYSRILDKK